ncbi:unnamed protein product [Prunus armeniaca]
MRLSWLAHSESNNGRLRSEGCLHVRLPIGSPLTPTKVLGLRYSADPRSENSHADALSCLASAINDRIGRRVLVEILSQPSTRTAEVPSSYGTRAHGCLQFMLS